MRDSTEDKLSNAKMMIDTIIFYNNFTYVYWNVEKLMEISPYKI